MQMIHATIMSAIVADFLSSEISKKQAENIVTLFAKLNSTKNKIPKLLKENKYNDIIERYH